MIYRAGELNMGFRDRLRQLERLTRGDDIEIPQRTGPPARFPVSQLEEAFKINMRRLRGEDVPPHPLSVAAANSPDPRWRQTFYADYQGEPPEDRSE